VTLFASLNGTPVTKARIVIPYTGIWHADVWLDRVADTSGSQSLQVDTLALTCSVVRQIDFTGESMVRLVGGAGGWRKQATPQIYAQANLSTILGDTASLVGEQVNVTTDSTVKPFYCVVAEDAQGNPMPASQVLQELLGDQWYMDPLGVIQQGPRPSPAIASPFTLRSVDGPPGIYQVDTDTIADWVPGATFSGPTGSGTISRVTHVLESGRLHTEVMVPAVASAPSDRLRAAFETMLRQYLPNLLFMAEWEYTVVAANGGPIVTIDAKPVDDRLPPASGIPLRPDASGGTSTPAVGDKVIVGFVGGNPKQPEVRSLDPAAVPTGVWFGGTNPVARLGDQVQCFLPVGLPIMTTQGPGTITAGGPISGVITQGSSVVNAK
jgi:hypothetical protein